MDRIRLLSEIQLSKKQSFNTIKSASPPNYTQLTSEDNFKNNDATILGSSSSLRILPGKTTVQDVRFATAEAKVDTSPNRSVSPGRPPISPRKFVPAEEIDLATMKSSKFKLSPKPEWDTENDTAKHTTVFETAPYPSMTLTEANTTNLKSEYMSPIHS